MSNVPRCLEGEIRRTREAGARSVTSSNAKHGFTPVSALTLSCLESSIGAWGIHIK